MSRHPRRRRPAPRPAARAVVSRGAGHATARRHPPGGGGRPRDDRGAGVIAAVAGATALLVFLLFTVQVLVGLYATSTLRAVLHDAASRAAAGPAREPAGRPGPALDRLAAEARASLGRLGEHARLTLRLVDEDGDGAADLVVGDAVAVAPRFLPAAFAGPAGLDEVRASVRARVERFR